MKNSSDSFYSRFFLVVFMKIQQYHKWVADANITFDPGKQVAKHVPITFMSMIKPKCLVLNAYSTLMANDCV